MTDSYNKPNEANDSGARRRQADTFGGSVTGTDADLGGESEPVSGSDLLSEQIRVLYSNARRSIWANYVALIAFVAVGYADVPATILWGWTGCVAGLLFVRYLIVVSRLQRPGFPHPVASVAFEYTVGTTLTGMTFAAGFLLFAPEVSDHQRSLMLVIIAGMCAGASTSMASHRPAYYGYAFSLLLPAMGYAGIVFWREGTLTSATETCIIAAYAGVVMVIHTGIETFIRDNLLLQLEKARQVDRLEHVNVTLSRDRDAFHKASLTDGLTGIPNRRSFDETLESQWDRCMQRGSRLSCLLVDVDYFKKFNDHYGHDAGDRCLVRVAGAMSEVVHRQGDYLARYGGEEFVVLLTDTASAGAFYIGELVRQAVESLAVPNEGSPNGVVTVSVGASSITPSAERRSAELLKRTDEALYAAKAHGRNRVQLLHVNGDFAIDGGASLAGASLETVAQGNTQSS